MCGFNYRFVPAVRRARELLETGGIGDVVHFRATYLQSWGWEADGDVWRFDPANVDHLPHDMVYCELCLQLDAYERRLC